MQVSHGRPQAEMAGKQTVVFFNKLEKTEK